MKRLSMIALVFVLTASLCGCSRKQEPAPTTPQNNTQPSTMAPTVMPEIDPTLDTNIPDPTVNENSQGMGDMEEDSTDSTSGTENNDIGTDNNENGFDNATRSRMFRK